MIQWDGTDMSKPNKPGPDAHARSDETWVLGTMVGIFGLVVAVAVVGTIANLFMMLTDALSGAW